MLQKIEKHFEIIIFNNSPKKITDAIVELMLKYAPENFNKNCISHVLSKENCCTNEIHNDIKNLDFLTGDGTGRTVKDSIIVDNSVFCF
jgi:TFIIF-interacting CTD phosphatase-like protein